MWSWGLDLGIWILRGHNAIHSKERSQRMQFKNVFFKRNGLYYSPERLPGLVGHLSCSVCVTAAGGRVVLSAGRLLSGCLGCSMDLTDHKNRVQRGSVWALPPCPQSLDWPREL